MNARTFAAGLALALSLAGTSALAQSNPARSPWNVAIEVGPVWQHDASMQAFLSGNGVPPSSGLSVGRDVLHLGSHFTLGAEVGFRTVANKGYVRQAFTTSLNAWQLQAGLSLRWELTRWFTPYARLTAGAMALDASVRDPPDHTPPASAWTAHGGAGLGVLLTSGAWFEGVGATTLRFTLAVEGGYQRALPATLDASPPAPTDERLAADQIALQSTTMGAVNPSAAYLRVAFGARF